MLLKRRVWRALDEALLPATQEHGVHKNAAQSHEAGSRRLGASSRRIRFSGCQSVELQTVPATPLALFGDHLCAAQALWAADLCVSGSRSRFSCARRWRPEDQLALGWGPSPLVQQHRPHGVQLQSRGSSSSLHAACRAMQHRRRPTQAPMHRHHSQDCTMAGIAACLPAMPSPQHATSLAYSCLRPQCMQQQLRTTTATVLPHPTFWHMCCQSSSPLKPSSQASN